MCTAKSAMSGVVAILSVALVAEVMAREQAGPRLDSRIGPAVPSRYRDILDAKHWRNPSIVVLHDGFTVASQSLPFARRVASDLELQAVLAGLPVSDWPYGRVVRAADNGIGQVDGSDRELIRRNRAACTSVLRVLRVSAEWWPSA
jgi:hypothetical protein